MTIEPRRAPHVNPAALAEPFEWIEHDKCYEIASILRPIPAESIQADPGDFPNNIATYYWISEGENDEKPWYALGQLTNGNYFFYSAWCVYTGFECSGEMQLWVSASFESLTKYAMDSATYADYIAGTEAPK